MKTQPTAAIRQGDVLLLPVAALPADVTEVPDQQRKIVLAWGEVTGHHHRIEDHRPAQRAGEIADATTSRAKARLVVAPTGERYLEVSEPVTLSHEEHTAHVIPAGVYLLPQQVEYTPSELRRVED